jgi:hypothetical protein
VVFDVRNISAEDFVTKLNSVLEHPLVAMLLEGKVSAIAEGSKVNLSVLFKAKVASQVRAFGELITIIQDQLKVDQSLEVNLRLAASPKDLLSEGGSPALLLLLNGISLDIRMNLWKKLSDLLMRIVGNCEVDASLLPILGGIAPLLMLEIGGNLDIKIDETMKQKISENPLVEPVLMDADTLITSVSGNSFETDEEFYKHLAEVIPPPFSDLATLMCQHLGDEVNFEVLDEYVGLKGRIGGEGLALILKNGLKFAK